MITNIVKRVQSDHPLSRFGRSDEIYEGSDVYLDLINLPQQPSSTSDVTFIVTKYEKDRLDRISFKFYQTVSLYWVIAHVNNIVDPFDVPIGTVLRIPSLTSLYGDGGLLL